MSLTYDQRSLGRTGLHCPGVRLHLMRIMASLDSEYQRVPQDSELAFLPFRLNFSGFAAFNSDTLHEVLTREVSYQKYMTN